MNNAIRNKTLVAMDAVQEAEQYIKMLRDAIEEYPSVKVNGNCTAWDIVNSAYIEMSDTKAGLRMILNSP